MPIYPLPILYPKNSTPSLFYKYQQYQRIFVYAYVFVQTEVPDVGHNLEQKRVVVHCKMNDCCIDRNTIYFKIVNIYKNTCWKEKANTKWTKTKNSRYFTHSNTHCNETIANHLLPKPKFTNKQRAKKRNLFLRVLFKWVLSFVLEWLTTQSRNTNKRSLLTDPRTGCWAQWKVN